MSRLNNTLRFTTTFLNTLIFFVGVGAIMSGSYVINIMKARFSGDNLDAWTVWIIVAGIVFIVVAVTGCLGTFRQIQRKGKEGTVILLPYPDHPYAPLCMGSRCFLEPSD